MILGLTAAEADQPAPTQGSLAALTAKVNGDAAHIHDLTEQLDEARLQVASTDSRLAAVTEQDATAAQQMAASRGVLVQQALRAYMQGGVSLEMQTASTATDMTVSQAYLQVASGDVAETGDQLHQLDVNLRTDEVTLRGAQRANLAATAQLTALRTNALAVAASEQVQLESLQTQLAVQAQSQAAAAARASAARATQGLPVNNGLVTVVQQAAGLPIATPVATAPVTTAPVVARPPAASGGGGAGGVWLELRNCESSDNYQENTGNGFYGAYQFSQSTWIGLGFPGRPDLEPPAMQDEAAMKDQAISGWGQWPACSAALGLL